MLGSYWRDGRRCVIAEWELARIELLLEEDVDVIVHMAWYETTDFWTLANYRRLPKPRLTREIERVYQAVRQFRYIITKPGRPTFRICSTWG